MASLLETNHCCKACGLGILLALWLGGCGGANTEVAGYRAEPPNPSGATHRSPTNDSHSYSNASGPAGSGSTANANAMSGPTFRGLPLDSDPAGETAPGPGTLENVITAVTNPERSASFSSSASGAADPFLPKLPVTESVSVPRFEPDPCAGRNSQIEVITSTHRLYLCDQGRSEGSFEVAFGLGGFYKHEEGDGRTPIGEYALSAPEASSDCHLFIPIQYPGPADWAYARSHGISDPGGDVGIHGPARSLLTEKESSWPLNWTDGCIAVSSDAEIDEIGNWVVAHPGATINIEPPDQSGAVPIRQRTRFRDIR